jgi:peptidoglycan hydrolase-like protein with peptidoglycan-binding domain
VGKLTVRGKAAARGYAKVDKRLRDIIAKAAERSRFDVEVFSGIRYKKPGVKGGQHHKGTGIDVALSTPDGTKLPNLASKQTYEAYREFAKEVHAVAKEQGLEKELGWGGNFGPSDLNPSGFDYMHFDLGGARGKFGTILGGLNDLGKAAFAKLGFGSLYDADQEAPAKALPETAMAFLNSGEPGTVQVAGMGAGNAVAQMGAPGSLAIQSGPLKKGFSGEPVKDLQRFLQKQGYSVGPTGVDGDFGGATKKALEAYQRDRGLVKVDGQVGPETRGAMVKDVAPARAVEAVASADLAPTSAFEPPGRLRRSLSAVEAVAGADLAPTSAIEPAGRIKTTLDGNRAVELQKSNAIARDIGVASSDLAPTSAPEPAGRSVTAAQRQSATDELRGKLADIGSTGAPVPRPNPTPTPNQITNAQEAIRTNMGPASSPSTVNDTIRKSMQKSFDILGSASNFQPASGPTGNTIQAKSVPTSSIKQSIQTKPAGNPIEAGTGGGVPSQTGYGGFGSQEAQRAAVGAFQASGQPSAPVSRETPPVAAATVPRSVAKPASAPQSTHAGDGVLSRAVADAIMASAAKQANGASILDFSNAAAGAWGSPAATAAKPASAPAAKAPTPLTPVNRAVPLAPLPAPKTIGVPPVAGALPGTAPLPTTDIPASMQPGYGQAVPQPAAVPAAAPPSILKRMAPGMIMGALTGGVPGMAMSAVSSLIRGSLGNVNNPNGLGFNQDTFNRTNSFTPQQSDMVGGMHGAASYGRTTKNSDGSTTTRGTTSTGTGYESHNGGDRIDVGGRTYTKNKRGTYSLNV